MTETQEKTRQDIEPTSVRLFTQKSDLVDQIRSSLDIPVSLMGFAQAFTNAPNAFITEKGTTCIKSTIILPKGWGELLQIGGQVSARWSEAPREFYGQFLDQVIREAYARASNSNRQNWLYKVEHNLTPYEILERLEK